MRASTLFAALLALSFASCSFKKNPGQDNTAVAPETPPTDVIKTIQEEQERQAFEGKLTEENVSLEFVELENPNTYKMIVRWPKQIKRLQLDINDLDPIFKTIADDVSTYERTVVGNQLQTVRLTAFDTLGGPISTITLKRKSPRDIIYGSTENLKKSEYINANRIYFLEQGRIITNGYDLSISANKIYILKGPESEARSDIYSRQANSQIMTNLLGTNTEVGVPTSSNIVVTAKMAIGHLAVLMIGKNGSDGVDGQEIEKQLRIGKVAHPTYNGANGQDGVLTYSTKKCSHRSGPDSGPCEMSYAKCDKQPTNGESGKPGLKGLGAPGGAGGLGGKAGKNPGPPCIAAQDGANGSTGARGKDGKHGIAGKVGEVITNVSKVKELVL